MDARLASTIVSLLLAVAGCGDDAGADAGALDGGGADSATVDAGPRPDAGSDVHACGFHLGLAPEENYLVFEGESEDIGVLIVRRATGGPGYYTEFTLLGFALRRGDDLRCVDQAADLAYESTHHNWVDAASAVIDGVTYRLDMRYQPVGTDPVTDPWEWRYTITGLDAGGATVWGPHALSLVEGTPGSGY